METGACAMRGTSTRNEGTSDKPASFGSSTPLGKLNRRDTHLLREPERHQIDDELLVGANIGAGVLWLSRSLAADANTYCRGIAAKHIEERERRGVDCAGSVTGRHPCDRSRQNRREQQSVAFERAHPFKIKLHGLLRSLVARLIRSALARRLGSLLSALRLCGLQ